jgi:hypothetical protein
MSYRPTESRSAAPATFSGAQLSRLHGAEPDPSLPPLAARWTKEAPSGRSKAHHRPRSVGLGPGPGPSLAQTAPPFSWPESFRFARCGALSVALRKRPIRRAASPLDSRRAHGRAPGARGRSGRPRADAASAAARARAPVKAPCQECGGRGYVETVTGGGRIVADPTTECVTRSARGLIPEDMPSLSSESYWQVTIGSRFGPGTRAAAPGGQSSATRSPRRTRPPAATVA